jgi:hypothetical protein
MHMSMTCTPERELRDSLDEFETSLATPVVAGELAVWIKTAHAKWNEASAQTHYHIGHMHSRQYQQISHEDPEMHACVERLKVEDNKLEQDREALNRMIVRVVGHAPKFEHDEEKIHHHTQHMIDAGLAFVARVRKQEVTIQTWFMEAFNRDRGVAD